MITLYTLEEIEKISTISEAFKEELRRYFREIADGIVGEAWKSYNLEEVGAILVVEKEDTVDVLDEYGLMQGDKTIAISIPEFALRAKVDGKDMLKIIWVTGDSFGVSVYYTIGQFGRGFDEFIIEFLMD